MELSRNQRVWLQRAGAVLVALVLVPIMVAAGTFADEAPIRVGEPAPRTVVADQQIRIVDEEQTQEERDRAAQSVSPVTVPDEEARAATIQTVRDLFAAVRAVRAPQEAPRQADGEQTEAAVPSVDEQAQQLAAQVDVLDESQLRELVALSSSQLAQVEAETVDLTQDLVRQQIPPDELGTVVDRFLRTELNIRSFPGDLEQTVIAPLVRAVARPTVTTDPESTKAARDRAAEQVPPVSRNWQPGEPIVREGEIVGAIEMEALRQRGLEGADPGIALLRAFAAMLLVVAILGAYLRHMQPRVWASARRLLLFSVLIAAYALTVVGANLLASPTSPGWWFALPAAGFAMLAALLVAPVVGIATMLPAVVLLLVVAPETTGVAVFVAATVLLAVPFVTSVASRGDLRTATYRVGAALPATAIVSVLVFGPRDELGVAAVAGVAGAVLTAMLVQGLLPFLETSFRLPTVTALLDLADRNHPLLRELEQKALGSYNHSVMVASLVERGCREVGANALLGNVAALYHDIGKVRQPHFFIENQQGIRNPHDDLDPEISAVIIQNHVIDGVEMAKEYKLPPEVVACIGSHHGTMLVTYFYRKALDRASGDLERIDPDHFRYKGTKPRAKEAGILLMADCCEAATRSAAMDRGTLPRVEIEQICDRLIQERVDDGQFAECDLTFDEMSRVRNAIVEALVGIYHPRIAYPEAQAESEAPDPVATS